MALHLRPAAAFFALAIGGSIAASGCAHRASATIRDDTTTISGHSTAERSPAEARSIVLVEAASITLDHGYRLFRIETPIRPGAPVTIRLYREGEAGAGAPDVYDADAIAAGNFRSGSDSQNPPQ